MITSVKLFVRYLHYDALNYSYRTVDDCFSSNIKTFKEYLIKYPGLAGSIGYGKRIRHDLKAWIILQITDNKGGLRTLEFETAKQFIEFVRKDKELSDKLLVQ